jgi:hypothetical protein
MTLRVAARIEWEKRERQRDADRMEQEQRACQEAIRAFHRQFGFHADTAVYNRADRRVELEFDRGTVTVARLYDGGEVWTWHVVLPCEACGHPVLAHEVADLADIHEALTRGLDDVVDDHYCAPAEIGRRLAEYVDVATL